MKGPEEIYLEYMHWCLHSEIEPPSRQEYEKCLLKIPDNPNNVDAILRNNNRKKDR